MIRAALFVVCTLSLSGCYYFQAARGQLDVMSRREPIAEIVAIDSTPEELSRRLELVLEARQFAVDELHLPDNDSYRSYADLGRDYVVWNVFAAPEFSLEPKTWCFPVAGCVAYRGYFSERAAEKKAVGAGGTAILLAYDTRDFFRSCVLLYADLTGSRRYGR